MVSMALLLVVLVMSLVFLFSMQTFSRRQQLFVEPRQTSRRAVDYISYLVRNAGARVTSGNSGLVTYALTGWTGGGGGTSSPVQVTFNNLTASQASAGYGDLGTDLINVILPAGDFFIPVKKYQGGTGGAAAVMFINFSKGCPDDTVNEQMFRDECQCGESDNPYGYGSIISVFDDSGTVISAELDKTPVGIQSMCSQGQIKLNFNSGLSPYNPPGGFPELQCPTCNVGSMQYASLRVKNGELQQGSAIFNPSAVDAGFVPLLDNVEDLQIAYIYNDGNIYNNATNHRIPTTANTPDQVPSAVPGDPYEIKNVMALRITVVARSSMPAPHVITNRYFRPAAEDHAAGSHDKFYHHRLTATIVIRNQILGD